MVAAVCQAKDQYPASAFPCVVGLPNARVSVREAKKDVVRINRVKTCRSSIVVTS